jgi:hypothetical protein
VGRWYQAEQGAGSRLWLYSERGLMSYLLCHVLPCELAFVLDNARDQDGVQLRDVVGTPTSHTTLTEFELGNQGFGSPDGGVAITAGDRTSFVFVEAKQREFGASRTDPVLRTPEDLSDPDLDIDKLCRGNTFNSAINGQLELRWRFVNAFRTSAAAGDRLVSERHVARHPNRLPAELTTCDRFYWRLFLRPQPDVPEHWRRVDMSSDLRCLYDLLSAVREFYLLAVTFDDRVPDFRGDLRLFDPAGNRVDVAGRVFWLDGRLIENRLTRPR